MLIYHHYCHELAKKKKSVSTSTAISMCFFICFLRLYSQCLLISSFLDFKSLLSVFHRVQPRKALCILLFISALVIFSFLSWAGDFGDVQRLLGDELLVLAAFEHVAGIEDARGIL